MGARRSDPDQPPVPAAYDPERDPDPAQGSSPIPDPLPRELAPDPDRELAEIAGPGDDMRGDAPTS